jgi:hypothetical protein
VVSRRAGAAARADDDAAGVDDGAGAGVRGDLRKQESALSIPLAARRADDEAGGSGDAGCGGLGRTGGIGEAESVIEGLAVGEK